MKKVASILVPIGAIWLILSPAYAHEPDRPLPGKVCTDATSTVGEFLAAQDEATKRSLQNLSDLATGPEIARGADSVLLSLPQEPGWLAKISRGTQSSEDYQRDLRYGQSIYDAGISVRGIRVGTPIKKWIINDGKVAGAVIPRIEGASLERYIKNPKIPLTDVFARIGEAAEVLNALHEKGFVHGDPQCRNWMVSIAGVHAVDLSAPASDYTIARDNKNFSRNVETILEGRRGPDGHPTDAEIAHVLERLKPAPP